MKTRAVFLNLLVSLGGLLFIFLLLEIILRIFPHYDLLINDPYKYTKRVGQVKYGQPFSSYREIYPKQFDIRKYYRRSNYCIDYNFNQFNGRWIRSEVQELGDSNVLVVGDSFTYGFALRYEDSYIFKLQERLNKEGWNISFLNFSRPAADSRKCLAMYIKKKYIPHKLLLYGLHMNKFIQFPTSYIINHVNVTNNLITKMESLAIKSRLLDFIFKNMCKITSRRKNIKELLDPNNFKKEFFIENFKAVLSMKQEALTNGADFTVVILPVLIDLKSGTFNPVYNRIKTLFDENDIKYFDLTSAVAGYSDKYLWILPFDQHPNEIANEIFAQKLRDFFIKDYILGSDRIFQKSVVGQLE